MGSGTSSCRPQEARYETRNAGARGKRTPIRGRWQHLKQPDAAIARVSAGPRRNRAGLSKALALNAVLKLVVVSLQSVPGQSQTITAHPPFQMKMARSMWTDHREVQ